MARRADVEVTLDARTGLANAAGADMFISLHRNAFTSPGANGVEIWVYTSPTAAELGAACEMLEQLSAAGIQSNRGVKRGNFHVLRQSKMPAVMIELGFITNERDNRLFDGSLDAYARAITRGACNALGVPCRVPGGEAENTAKETLYRIQVGAFRVKENAENFLKTVRDMGLDAFMVSADISAGD
jgi:N-acetylmuramoyl-L-alanine amidase